MRNYGKFVGIRIIKYSSLYVGEEQLFTESIFIQRGIRYEWINKKTQLTAFI
jgi:hypothetical protein